MLERKFTTRQCRSKTLTAAVGELVGAGDGGLVGGTVGFGVGDFVGAFVGYSDYGKVLVKNTRYSQ